MRMVRDAHRPRKDRTLALAIDPSKLPYGRFIDAALGNDLTPGPIGQIG